MLRKKRGEMRTRPYWNFIGFILNRKKAGKGSLSRALMFLKGA